jgi:hypothetical protein
MTGYKVFWAHGESADLVFHGTGPEQAQAQAEAAGYVVQEIGTGPDGEPVLILQG